MRTSTKPWASNGSAVVLSAALMLTGCASTKDAIIPQDGPDMAAIYEQHTGGGANGGYVISRRAELRGPVSQDPPDLDGYSRTSANENRSLFPWLANPTLVMFVFPHLSGEDAPVPGYSTSFRMYERDHHALPGEPVADRGGQP